MKLSSSKFEDRHAGALPGCVQYVSNPKPVHVTRQARIRLGMHVIVGSMIASVPTTALILPAINDLPRDVTKAVLVNLKARFWQVALTIENLAMLKSAKKFD